MMRSRWLNVDVPMLPCPLAEGAVAVVVQFVVLRGAVTVQLSAPRAPSRRPHKPLTSTNTRPTAVRALIPINASFPAQRVP